MGPMSRKLSANSLVKETFRKLLSGLFGEPCLSLLESHLLKVFGKDPYDVLCNDPKSFCRELRAIFGEGFNALVSAAAQKLIKNYSLNWEREVDLASAAEDDDLVGQELLNLLVDAASKVAKEVAPGALILNSQERESITRFLDFAKAGGGLEEVIFNKPGWAVKIGRIMVFGIEFADKRIPVALYSRRYARFRQLANEWITRIPCAMRYVGRKAADLVKR